MRQDRLRVLVLAFALAVPLSLCFFFAARTLERANRWSWLPGSACRQALADYRTARYTHGRFSDEEQRAAALAVYRCGAARARKEAGVD